jgi:hypothetical protein
MEPGDLLYLFLLARLQQELVRMPVLDSPCLSVYLSACNKSRTTKQIFMKYDTGVLLKRVNMYQFWLKSDNKKEHY